MKAIPDSALTVKDAWRVLEGIADPEIPAISVVELGIIADVAVNENRVIVKLTPSFAACPAIDYMRRAIAEKLTEGGFDEARVDIVFDPPWTTDRISETGREKLRAFGLAPPRTMNGRSVEPRDLTAVPCPFCGSTHTTLESTFGPTLCRSIHYCDDCRQSFEHMKPVT